MKRIFLLFALIACFCSLSAQTTFFIPDSNFFNAILTPNATYNVNNVAINCASCVVDATTREINSACLDSLNIYSLNVGNKGIVNLQGIQSFVDLRILYCEYNQLSNLSILPSELTFLYCNNNVLNSLPILPNHLTFLYCNNNLLDSLPTLPHTLTYLNCSSNALNSSFVLPNSLTYLNCSYNFINNLPALPESLQYLYCQNNVLTDLPHIWNDLIYLNCSNNLLDSLPNLSTHLAFLYCGDNQIRKLPRLPSTLEILVCNSNHLTYIGDLPSNLNTLQCRNNQLTNLPILPNNLKQLNCRFNFLHELPSLSSLLFDLDCYGNYLTYLPILPNTLTALNCSNNEIEHLPKLSNNLKILSCKNNQLFCLPNIPTSITTLNINNNFITCLPNYTANITEANTGLPLCNENNPQCSPLSTSGESESFPPTSIRKIVHDTLYLPFTSPAIDIIDYEIAVYNKTPTQKDTLVIFGCDVVLGKPQQINTLYSIASPITTWEGKIPYNPVGISDSIRRAIQYFNVRAGLMGLRIAFVPKQPTDIDFVTFRHSPGRFASYVGKIGGEQYIWADTAGFTGKILHEMTHTLGMYHEHQRDSAQFYVNIQTQYIRTAFADAFCRIKDIQTTPYDYNSLMHYICFAFSKFSPFDGVNLNVTHNTILPTQAMNDAEMGQRSDYTDYDIADINQLYPDGLVGGIGFSGTGIFRLLIDTTNVASIAWSVYNTEPLVFAGNTYNIDVTATNVNGSMTKAAITTPFPAGAPRAARGFVVATVTFTNGQQKKFYKYVYRN